jgi:hypothetical protein
MRNLTLAQKKLLKEWFVKNYDEGCKFDLALKIDDETYNRIESINNTEVFYQNANNYLESLVDDRVSMIF